MDVTSESLEVVLKLMLSLMALGFVELNLRMNIFLDLFTTGDIIFDGVDPVVEDLLLVVNCNPVVVKLDVLDGLVPCILV
jgi:hypothetical protein